MDNPFLIIEQRLDRIEKLLKAKQVSAKELVQPDKMSMDEALKYLNASGLPMKRSQLYQLTHRADIPVSRIGKRLIFSRRELAEWLETRMIKKQPTIEMMSKRLAKEAAKK
jgi:hypothetical protein